LLELLKQAALVPGDICEMGVYKGGTAYLIADFMKKTKFPGRLYLFDTFKGTMGLTEKDSARLRGNYRDTDLNEVKSHLGSFVDFISYVEGLIPESFRETNLEKIAFANVHLNVYHATRETLRFIYPKLSAGGIIIIQDYGNKKYCAGVKDAVDEFSATIDESPLYIGEKQAIIIKHNRY
jgi:O-methyltransferase